MNATAAAILANARVLGLQAEMNSIAAHTHLRAPTPEDVCAALRPRLHDLYREIEEASRGQDAARAECDRLAPDEDE